MTTQTEILAEGRPRTLGQTNSPFEIVREPKNAPFAERYLRMSGFPVYKLGRICETCPPLFRHLAEAPGAGRLSVTEFKDRLASGLGSVGEDVLAVMSSVLPVGEYVPLLLRLWPRLVVPGEPGDYFAEERLAAFPDVELWDREDQPSGPYYRGTTMSLRESRELFEFAFPWLQCRHSTRNGFVTTRPSSRADHLRPRLRYRYWTDHEATIRICP